jgi:hypothetical protein
MHAAMEKLVLQADSALSLEGASEVSPVLAQLGPAGESLAELLKRRNGFYGFGCALLVRPYFATQPPLGIVQWNDPRLWKSAYVDDLESVTFFAEDIFGCQFGVRNREVYVLDPETGSLERAYASLEDWANAILEDDAVSGRLLAHAWIAARGPIRPGTRLVPKVPFVCGGAYEIDNLYAIDDVQSMRLRASIANQIRDLPDGAEIVLDISREDRLQ